MFSKPFFSDSRTVYSNDCPISSLLIVSANILINSINYSMYRGGEFYFPREEIKNSECSSKNFLFVSMYSLFSLSLWRLLYYLCLQKLSFSFYPAINSKFAKTSDWRPLFLRICIISSSSPYSQDIFWLNIMTSLGKRILDFCSF